MSFHVPNKHRVVRGPLASDNAAGNNGMFMVPITTRIGRTVLRVIASDGEGWEHVSVSHPKRCPTWDEMCAIKSIFWDEDDCAMQLHPPRSQWVNNHQFCLHLWRPASAEIPRPPSWMVGFRELGTLA